MELGSSLLRLRFCVVILAASASLCSRESRAGESQEFIEKTAATHCQDENCKSSLRRLLSRQGVTRNIGTEDPDAVAGPNNSWHPASRAACQARALATGAIKQNESFKTICGGPWMAPVTLPGQAPEQAKVCIDQFEFPDIPCEYPIVWTPSGSGEQICRAMGKRLCNSHEWEGACAGSIDPGDTYHFDLGSYQLRRAAHNQREITWAFSWKPEFSLLRDTRKICGVYEAGDPDQDPRVAGKYTSIGTSVGCDPSGSAYATCGTNAWPSGFKAECATERGVYDMHGNVAETVNLPDSEQGLADSRGTVDRTEHKGSFFVYRGPSMYPDDCRIRQPEEHHNRIASDGMAFYQEGFRCCKDVE